MDRDGLVTTLGLLIGDERRARFVLDWLRDHPNEAMVALDWREVTQAEFAAAPGGADRCTVTAVERPTDSFHHWHFYLR